MGEKIVKNKAYFNLIRNLVSVVVSLLLLISTVYAWYCVNKEASVTGVTGIVASGDDVQFTDTVTSVRHCMNGDINTWTYKVDAGRMYLVKESNYLAESDSTEVINHELSEKIPFSIKEILPSEYIDITFGYYMNSSNGSSYEIKLNDITSGSFTVDNHTHYASGAFKYKSISLIDENKNNVIDFSASSATWFNTYSVEQDDIFPGYITLLNHTWNNQYGKLYYTFRITEDFSQYYELISKSEGSYGNLLSKLNLSVGYIFLIH